MYNKSVDTSKEVPLFTHHPERGQALIIIALALVGLVGMGRPGSGWWQCSP